MRFDSITVGPGSTTLPSLGRLARIIHGPMKNHDAVPIEKVSLEELRQKGCL